MLELVRARPRKSEIIRVGESTVASLLFVRWWSARATQDDCRFLDVQAEGAEAAVTAPPPLQRAK